MANQFRVTKKYGSPALANLSGKPMLQANRVARIKTTPTKPAKKRKLPSYRGSFNHK